MAHWMVGKNPSGLQHGRVPPEIEINFRFPSFSNGTMLECWVPNSSPTLRVK